MSWRIGTWTSDEGKWNGSVSDLILDREAENKSLALACLQLARCDLSMDNHRVAELLEQPPRFIPLYTSVLV